MTSSHRVECFSAVIVCRNGKCSSAECGKSNMFTQVSRVNLILGPDSCKYYNYILVKI